MAEACWHCECTINRAITSTNKICTDKECKYFNQKIPLIEIQKQRCAPDEETDPIWIAFKYLLNDSEATDVMSISSLLSRFRSMARALLAERTRTTIEINFPQDRERVSISTKALQVLTEENDHL
ncbi:hypothetical protein RUND412_011270 [Rhizina undulata]